MTQDQALERSLHLAAITKGTEKIAALVEEAHGFCVDLSAMIYNARWDAKRRARLLRTLDLATIRYIRRTLLAGFQNGGPHQ